MTMITATGIDALIDPEVSTEIIQDVAAGGSQVMPLMRGLPNMSTKQKTIKVLNALPSSYFVSGATGSSAPGRKPMASVEWADKTITAEELAVIVPIPEELLEDTDYDVWGEIKPLLVEAFGVTIDAALLHSTNKPASWPVGVVAGATAAGMTVAEGSVGDDLYDDLLVADGLFAKVEGIGYEVEASVAGVVMQGKLRGVRDDVGQPIFKREGMQGKTSYYLDGTPVRFPKTGALDTDEALMISGAWSKLVYAMRKDITYKILTEATIQNVVTGEIEYNLAQQDMVALRAVMRLGWQVPNPISRMEQTAASRYPVAILTPAAGS